MAKNVRTEEEEGDELRIYARRFLFSSKEWLKLGTKFLLNSIFFCKTDFSLVNDASHRKYLNFSHFTYRVLIIIFKYYDLYTSPNIARVITSRRMRWVGHVACMGEERGVYRVLVGKLEGRRPLGRPGHRWMDIIRMDLQDVECGYMDWIGLAHDGDRWWMLVSAVMNLRVLWNAGNFLTSCKPVSFSRRTLHHGVSK